MVLIEYVWESLELEESVASSTLFVEESRNRAIAAAHWACSWQLNLFYTRGSREGKKYSSDYLKVLEGYITKY